jgi:cytochrome bd-type quinol oxidase subunit 2
MLWILLGVVVVSLAIYAMVSISVSHMEKSKKMLWFAIAALLPLLGPLLYFFLKPHR